MKIINHTAERLILEDRPLLLGAMLVAVILLLAGFALSKFLAGDLSGLLPALAAIGFGVALVIFVRRTQVILDRATGQLSIRVASLRRETVQDIPLSKVTGALTEARTSRSGRHNRRTVTLHRVVVHIHGQAAVMPLMQVFVAGDDAARAADAINTWLEQMRHGSAAGR